MDRRSWLWRRKSSEKSPGETDSSGSISSHSERFSDDQVYPSNNFQSPEVMSKAVLVDEEVSENVKTLTEKLSAALLNVSAKEELVKQHAKVAEEAVSGWERAEQELFVLKQQLEASSKKNSELEDRARHLDAALKECMRQLRQAREEQDRKSSEVLDKKTGEWETEKSELEMQVCELRTQLQTAKSEAAVTVPNLQQKLDAAERETSYLKTKLLSQAEELEMRILERDLSTKVAETASKQRLESIKKVSKLEAECRRLNAMIRKVSDHTPFTVSSIGVESYADSQSDSGEKLIAVENEVCKTIGSEMSGSETSCSDSCSAVLVTKHNQRKNRKVIERNLMVPYVEIDLMDDFLEMERLAAFPETETGSSCLEGPFSNQPSHGNVQLKADLEAMIRRTAELEEKLEKLEEEKIQSETALSECQRQLDRLKAQLHEADVKLAELQAQLNLANESKQAVEEEIEGIKARRELAESQLRIAEAEIKRLHSEVDSLDVQVHQERGLSAENFAKCQKLEDELSKIKHEAELQHEAELHHVASFNEELKIKQEKELAVAASKFAECQKTILSLDRQLKSLATMEDFLLESEKSLDLGGEEQKCPTGDGDQQRLSDSYSHRGNVVKGMSKRTIINM